jgi:hypothetical protein
VVQRLSGPAIVHVLHSVQENLKKDSATTHAPAPTDTSSIVSTTPAVHNAPSPLTIAKESHEATQPHQATTSSQSAVVAIPPTGPHKSPRVPPTSKATNVTPQKVQLAASIPNSTIVSEFTLATPTTQPPFPTHPNIENAHTFKFVNISSAQSPLPLSIESSSASRSPRQADTTRLARDILRSLGRPSFKQGSCISPAPSFAAEISASNTKRKRSTSIEDDMEKRQKTSDAVGTVLVANTPASQPNSRDTTRPPSSATSMGIEPAFVDVQTLNAAIPIVPQAPATTLADEDSDVVIVEEPEEIATPGALEMALQEAAQAAASGLQEVASQAQVPTSAIHNAPPVGHFIISPPSAKEAASLPPSSRSSSPSQGELPTAGEIPDGGIYGTDAPQLQLSTSGIQSQSVDELIPPIATISDSSPTPVTPVAGPSKQPLFFVSPGSPRDVFRPSATLDENGVPDFMPSGLLDAGLPILIDKGKQRTHESDDVMDVDAPSTPHRGISVDSDIEIIEPPEPVKPRAWTGPMPRAEVFVSVPPPVHRLLLRRDKLVSGVRVVRGRIVSPDTSEENWTGQLR